MLVAAAVVGAVALMTWWLTPAAPSGVLVEVRGHVPQPGFHRIERGELREALEAAGHRGASSATPLHEGDLVRVGPDGVSIHPAGNPLLHGLPVDLNDAGPEALEAVPGLGRSLAVAIVTDRAQHGPFYAVADLTRVHGIGPGTVEAIAPLLTVGDVGPRPEPEPAPVGEPVGEPEVRSDVQRPVAAQVEASPDPLDLNTATAAELESLPGIGPVLAARIVVDRAERGRFESMEALDRVPGIGPATVEALAEHARVGGADGAQATD